MIAANIAAAIVWREPGGQFLYRAHEVPPPDKLEPFRDFVDSLGMNLPKGHIIRAQSFNKLLTQAKKDGTSRMVATLFSDVRLRLGTPLKT